MATTALAWLDVPTVHFQLTGQEEYIPDPARDGYYVQYIRAAVSLVQKRANIPLIDSVRIKEAIVYSPRQKIYLGIQAYIKTIDSIKYYSKEDDQSLDPSREVTLDSIGRIEKDHYAYEYSHLYIHPPSDGWPDTESVFVEHTVGIDPGDGYDNVADTLILAVRRSFEGFGLEPPANRITSLDRKIADLKDAFGRGIRS